MAVDARGHTAPAAGETPRRQATNDLSLSINDVVMAANATDRAQKLTLIGSSAARPLIIRQQDTGAYWEHNGSTWRLLFGSMYQSAAGGAGSGITDSLIVGLSVAAPGYPYRVTLDGRMEITLNATGANYVTILRSAAVGALGTPGATVDMDIDAVNTNGGTGRVHAVYESSNGAVGRDFGIWITRTAGTPTASVASDPLRNRLDARIEPL